MITTTCAWCALRGELDLSGTAVLHAQLRDIRWRARARSVADLTGLPFPGCGSLSVPARRCKPIRERAGNLALGGPQAAVARPVLPVIGLLTWFEAHDSAGHAITGTGPPRSAVFPAAPSSPRSSLKVKEKPPYQGGFHVTARLRRLLEVQAATND